MITAISNLLKFILQFFLGRLLTKKGGRQVETKPADEDDRRDVGRRIPDEPVE